MNLKSMRPFLMQNLEIKSEHYEKFIIGERDGSFYNTAGGNLENHHKLYIKTLLVTNLD